MKAHQRVIREQQARAELHVVPKDFSQATVREISKSEAKQVILPYEWLGNMGSTRYAFGLFFNGELAGVECFGSTAGTNTSVSVCGPKYRERVLTLCRGACVHWAHPHSASYLIPRACEMLGAKGFNIFVAYADEQAGEIGTVYQACNWLYCGYAATRGSLLQSPEGRLMDERNIGHYARCRSQLKSFFFKPTRAEIKQRLLEMGHKIIPRSPKHRYVQVCGSPALKRDLMDALRWPIYPYPKRVSSDYRG